MNHLKLMDSTSIMMTVMRRENGRKEMDDEQQQPSTDLFENDKRH